MRSAASGRRRSRSTSSCPKPIALSPERLLARADAKDTALIGALSGRPSNDAVLARALAAAGAVLVVAGTTGPTGMPLRAPPFTVRDTAKSDPVAKPVAPRLPQYPGVLTSIDPLDRAASGRGLISVDPEGGVIRRIPLAANVNGTLVPALAIEMLRAAIGAPSVRLHVSGSRVERCRDRRLRRAHRGRRRRPRLLFAAQRRSLRVGHRRPRRQGRPGAPRAEARADRRHRARPARIPEHSGGRAHARQRNPRAAPRKPLRRNAAAPAGLGAMARDGALPPARRMARVCHAALEAAQCGAAAGARRRAARRRRLRRLSDAADTVRRRDACRRSHAALRRAARADAHGGDTPKEVARSASCRSSASRRPASPASSKPRAGSRPRRCRAPTSSPATTGSTSRRL